MQKADELLRLWLQQNIQSSFSSNSNRSPKVTISTHDVGPYGNDIIPVINYTIPQSIDVKKGDSLPLKTSKVRSIGAQAFLVTTSAPSLRLAIASDSYFQWTGGPFIPNASSAVLPLVLDAQATLWLDNEDFSYASMQRIAKEFKPDVVIEEHSERQLPDLGLRRNHPEVILIGEKYLGNLKLSLTPDNSNAIRSHSAQVIASPDNIRIVASTVNPQIMVTYPVSTNAEGYAVVAAILQSPHKSRAVLHYKKLNEPWKRVVQQVSQGNNILNFQIIDTPNTSFEVRFEPGHAQGEYILLPMPFLNEIKEGIRQ